MRSLTAGLILSSTEATSNRASKQCTCPQTLEIRGWCNRSAKRYQGLCGPRAQRSPTYTYTLSEKWGKHRVYETSRCHSDTTFHFEMVYSQFRSRNCDRWNEHISAKCLPAHAPIPQAIFERVSHGSSVNFRTTCQKTQ